MIFDCSQCQVEDARITEDLQTKVKKPSFNYETSKEIGNILLEREKWTAERWEKESIQLLERNKIGRYNIVATSNYAHLNFTLNWIASLTLNDFDKFLVFCFDFELYQSLVRYGFMNNAVVAPLHWTEVQIKPTEQVWMKDQYNALTKAKLLIQNELLKRNYWILFSDVDLVFLSPSVLRHCKFLIGDYCDPVRAPTQCKFNSFRSCRL